MDPKDLKRAVRAAIAESVAPSADVRHALVTGVDPVVLTSIGVALRDLAPQTAGLRPVRLRVMGTASLGVLPSLLRAVLVGAGLAPVIETGEYGHFEMELAVGPLQGEPAPDAVLCLLSEDFFLPAEPQGMPCTDVIAYIEARAAEFRGLLEGAAQQVPATFILHTVPLTRAVRDSFISVRQRAAVAASWHRLNAELLAFTEEDHRFITMDLAGLLALQPIQARDNRLHKYGLGEHRYSG